jgi:hypothetical protein
MGGMGEGENGGDGGGGEWGGWGRGRMGGMGGGEMGEGGFPNLLTCQVGGNNIILMHFFLMKHSADAWKTN